MNKFFSMSFFVLLGICANQVMGHGSPKQDKVKDEKKKEVALIGIAKEVQQQEGGNNLYYHSPCGGGSLHALRTSGDRPKNSESSNRAFTQTSYSPFDPSNL